MNKAVSQTYQESTESTVNRCLRAIQALGYKVDSVDKANGLITFKTGLSLRSWRGQEMSAVVLDNGDGSSTVTVTGIRRTALQVYDWAEAAAIGRRLLERAGRF